MMYNQQVFSCFHYCPHIYTHVTAQLHSDKGMPNMSIYTITST